MEYPIEEYRLPTDYQNFIANSRYSRWIEEESRREIWPEPVVRYVENIVRPRIKGKVEDEDNLCLEIFKAIASCSLMPSMRALMTAGPAAERDEMALYNCSFIAVDHPRAFDEILYILTCGTGVGFSCETKYINKLPEVAESFHDTDSTIVVADSRIGWASSFRELLSLLWSGKVPLIDVSRVRPKGKRLVTFGGRASGPDPLVDLFNHCIRTFRAAAGRKLSSIEVHSIVCKIGEIVVVGGVRRSALISLSDLTDNRMRHAKSGSWWDRSPEFALANNSAVYEEKPDISTFLEEWKALYDSKSGERGIYNRDGIKKKTKGIGKRDPDLIVGTNPCLTYDTPLLTDKGYFPIGDLVGEKVNIWNGQQWSEVTPFSTGVNEIVRVSFTDGSHLDCTPYHKFLIVEGFNNNKVERIEAENLKPGMKLQKWDMPVVPIYRVTRDTPTSAYSQGFYSGDGTSGHTYSYVYEPKYSCIPHLIGEVVGGSNEGRMRWKHGQMKNKSFVPTNYDITYKLLWLAGLLDADGSVTRDTNGNGIQLTSIDHEFLSNVRLLLNTLGCRPKIVNGNPKGPRQMPDGKGGTDWYVCKETKRLLIGNQDTHHLIQLGLRCHRLVLHPETPQRDARQYIRVRSVEWLGTEEETFCVNEEALNQMTVNGIVTGNCGEIALRSAGLCNLTEVVIRSTDSIPDIQKKVEIATILGTIQSTYTNFRYVRSIWKKNADEERLLGVSLTGIYDNKLMSSSSHSTLATRLAILQATANKVNEDWAAILGINKSAAITTVKPSGTVSQLVDSASGIHPRYAKFYIRSVRGDNKDPMTQLLKDAGVSNEPCVSQPETTTVFYFPMKSPEGATTRDDVGVIQHLELWKLYNVFWSEHQVSVTINVEDKEWIDVAAWVYNNFDEITGISFLPFDGGSYRQAPYQVIGEGEYNELIDKMPKSIDWTKLSDYEKEDTTTGVRELACVAGVCEIV